MGFNEAPGVLQDLGKDTNPVICGHWDRALVVGLHDEGYAYLLPCLPGTIDNQKL